MSISKRMQNEIYELIGSYMHNKHSEDQMLKKIEIVIYRDKPKPRTISSRYSVVKAAFKENIPNIDINFLRKIKPPNELTEYLYKDNEQKRDDEKVMDIGERLVTSIMELRHSENVYDILIYILFISGRRISEIIESEFYDVTGGNNKRIGINGVKKKHNAGDGCEFTVLTNKKDFYDKVNFIRSGLEHVTLNTINRGLNRYIKRIYGDDFHTHMLRGMYALYMYKFRNPENIKINTYIQRVLCHTSIDSSLSYTGYNYGFNNDIVRNMKI